MRNMSATHFRIPDMEPFPEFRQSHLRNPEINLVREPLSKPVKEEEDARARDCDFDRFFAELLNALGFAANAMPGSNQIVSDPRRFSASFLRGPVQGLVAWGVRSAHPR